MEFHFKILLIVLSLFTSFSVSANRVAKLIFEPILGVESALVPYPEPPRFVTRATYGGRALYGITPLSAELEYLRSQSRKDYPNENLRVNDSVERASIGIRSTIPTGRFLAVYFRAGGRASRGETELIDNGVSEIRSNPLRIDPYAGAGLQLGLFQYLALNAGATLFRVSDNQYETQYTLGLSLRFGNI
jgi:hypothetical protein